MSPSTVYDVRQRLRAGQDPVTQPQKVHRSSVVPQPPTVCLARGVLGSAEAQGVEVVAILAGLRADPLLRHSDTGRSLLQCLNRYHVETAQSHTITGMVPGHCAGSVAMLARSYAGVWTGIAEFLEQRGNQQSS